MLEHDFTNLPDRRTDIKEGLVYFIDGSKIGHIPNIKRY